MAALCRYAHIGSIPRKEPQAKNSTVSLEDRAFFLWTKKKKKKSQKYSLHLEAN